MEYLGFCVTRYDAKPMDKNTSNNNMKPHTFRKEVRQFIGGVNYYRNILGENAYTRTTYN